MFRLDEYENTVERVTVQDALNVIFEENHQAQRRKTRERQEGQLNHQILHQK